MDLFLAISQGIGSSLATGIRALLVPLFIGVDGARQRRHRLRAHGIRVARVAVVARPVACVDGVRVAARPLRGRGSRGHLGGGRDGARGMLFAGALEDENYFGTAGIVPGMICALLGFLAARAFLGGAVDTARESRRERRHDQRAGRLRRTRDRGAGGTAAAHVVSRSRVLPLGAARPPPARRTEVRRPAHPAVDMTKLVLVMVDALKPAMLERAVAEGRAPAFAEILRRGTYFPDCVSVFPSVTPAAAASITTGTMPDVHGVPSICWYHRGEKRYVDYGSSAAAVRTFGVLRRIDGHGLQHELRSPAAAHADGVRAARRHGSAHGVHAVPDLPRPHASRAGRAGSGCGASRRRRTSGIRSTARPSSSTGSCIPRRRSTAARRSHDPARATRTPAASARIVEEHDLYDFMLFSLPDNDHHSHRFGPQATVESIARADRHLAELAEPAGGIESLPRRPRGDPDVRPRAGRGVGAASTSRTRSRTGGCCSRTTRASTRPSSRSRRVRARRWSTSSTGRTSRRVAASGC